MSGSVDQLAELGWDVTSLKRFPPLATHRKIEDYKEPRLVIPIESVAAVVDEHTENAGVACHIRRRPLRLLGTSVFLSRSSSTQYRMLGTTSGSLMMYLALIHSFDATYPNACATGVDAQARPDWTRVVHSAAGYDSSIFVRKLASLLVIRGANSCIFLGEPRSDARVTGLRDAYRGGK
jgi:hypothetical protein